MKYGKNLVWLLGELSSAEAEKFETGTIEIIAQNENEQDGPVEIEVTHLAGAAKKRITELENSLRGLIDHCNSLEDKGSFAISAETTLKHSEI